MNLRRSTIVVSLLLSIVSCKNSTNQEIKNIDTPNEPSIKFQSKGHELVYNMVDKVGNYQKLRSKKDVVYTYTYTTPDGKVDVSTEKYIFDGELSYGKYKRHERTLTQFEGTIEQGYDGKEFWLKANGNIVNDSTALKGVMFNRPTNFYWFAMFQKLLDPGLNYEYLGEKEIANNSFDIVKVSSESENSEPTDIYQLYINKSTGLVDQFLFTIVDFDIMDPRLMQIEYKSVDGFLIPTKRKYKKSTWDAKVTDAPWIVVDWSNIKFDNNLKKKDEFIK